MAGYTCLLSLLFLLPCCLCQTDLVQNPSNLGREFILAFTDKISDRGELYPKELVLTTPSDIPATVRITTPLLPINWEEIVTVTRNNLTTVELPSQLQALEIGKGKLGVHVVSTQDIVVVGSKTGYLKSEAFLGLPVYRLGLEYFVITKVNHPSFVIVGTRDRTEIEIHYPPVPNSNMERVERIVLNRYETYTKDDVDSKGDYSGVHIKADKPVGVVSGNEMNPGPYVEYDMGNRLLEMMVATRYWGKEFVTIDPSFASRGSEYKIIASQDDTEILLGDGQRHRLRRAGQYMSIYLRHKQYMSVTSRKPFAMMVFSQSVPFARIAAAMATIIPKKQYLNRYKIISMEGLGFENSLSVAIDANKLDGLLLDGSIVTGNVTEVLNSEMVVLEIPLSPGAHVLLHRDRKVRFLVLAAGTGVGSSYAYPAGMALRDIEPVTGNCKMSRPSPGDGIDNDCDGSVDEEQHNFKDDDGDGKIDEDLRPRPLNQYSCHVIKDPHLLTYASQHASLPIPCGYLLTDLKLRNTYLVPGAPYIDSIHIRILGGNGQHPINGRFYVTDVNVSIALVNGQSVIGSGKFTIGTEIIKEYGNWTSEINGYLYDRVQLSYDPSENLATLKIAYATPIVLFRPPVREQGNHQQKPPGLFFTVEDDLIDESLQRFPRSLASTLSDTTSFKEIADDLGIHEKTIGVYGVLETLQQNVTNDNDQDQVCPHLKEQYDNCERGKSAAFNTCAPMLFNSNIVKCLVEHNRELQVLTGYFECVRYMCTRHRVSCMAMRNFARSCPAIKILVQLPDCPYPEPDTPL